MQPARKPVFETAPAAEIQAEETQDTAKKPPLSVIPKLSTELYPKEIDCCIMATD